MGNLTTHMIARRYVARFGSSGAEARACDMSRRYVEAARAALDSGNWKAARHIARYRACLLGIARGSIA